MLAAGVDKIIITSAYRDAIGQASVMYDNLVAGFPASGGPAQQAVNQVYYDNQGASPSTIKAKMVGKINEIGPEKVSRHSRSPLFITVIDISAHDIPSGKREDFRNAVRAKLGGERVIGFGHPVSPHQGAEFNDPAFHIEMNTDAELARLKRAKVDLDFDC